MENTETKAKTHKHKRIPFRQFINEFRVKDKIVQHITDWLIQVRDDILDNPGKWRSIFDTIEKSITEKQIQARIVSIRLSINTDSNRIWDSLNLERVKCLISQDLKALEDISIPIFEEDHFMSGMKLFLHGPHEKGYYVLSAKYIMEQDKSS